MGDHGALHTVADKALLTNKDALWLATGTGLEVEKLEVWNMGKRACCRRYSRRGSKPAVVEMIKW